MINIIKTSPDDLWKKAADLLFDKIIESDSDRKKCLILLSGGSALNIYNILADKIRKFPIHVYRLAFAQVDERFQPQNSEDTNSHQIEKTGLLSLLKEKNIDFYPIPQIGSLEEASQKYDKTISKLFYEYDNKMAVLGIGEDGHTAGLLPGFQSAWDKTQFVAGFKNSGQFKKRLTITPKAIKLLDYALIAVKGEVKRVNLQKIISREVTEINKIPGVILNQLKQAHLITDLKVIYP